MKSRQYLQNCIFEQSPSIQVQEHRYQHTWRSQSASCWWFHQVLQEPCIWNGKRHSYAQYMRSGCVRTLLQCSYLRSSSEHLSLLHNLLWIQSYKFQHRWLLSEPVWISWHSVCCGTIHVVTAGCYWSLLFTGETQWWNELKFILNFCSLTQFQIGANNSRDDQNHTWWLWAAIVCNYIM